MADPARVPTDAAPPARGLISRLDGTGVPTLLARLVVGGLFIHHGLVKVGDPVKFLKLLKNYDILPVDPPLILNGVTVALPWIEVVIGLLLVFGIARRGAAVLSLGMLVVFTAAVFWLALDYQATHPEIAFTKIKLDCGCGGGPINVVLKMAENVGLMLASGWLMLSKSQRFIPPPFG